MTFEPENTTTALIVNLRNAPLSNYSAENVPAVPDTGDEKATWTKKDVAVANVTPNKTKSGGKTP